MAIIGNIAIGMSVGTAGLSKGLAAARSGLAAFASSVGSTGGLVAGVLGGAAAVAVTKLAGQFAHLDEAVNKTNAVFKTQGAEALAASKALSEAYGMSLTEVLDKSSQLGSMFAGAGFSDAAAANYSDVMARLANDLGRFNDVPFDQAFEKLRAGLSGESEPLRQFGIFLTEDAVQLKAYQMGLARVGQPLSEAAKIQARANIIMEKSGAAIGAAAREADGASAQMESLSGRWENLTTTIGEAFAPTVGAAMGGLGDLLKWLQDLWAANRDGAISWASGLAESMGFSTDSVDVLGTAVRFLGDAWDVMGLAFKFVQSYITEGLAKILDGLGYVASAFDWISEKISGSSAGLGEFFATYSDELHKLSEEQYKGFTDALIAPDTGKLLEASLNRTREGVKALREELAGKSNDLMASTGAKGTAEVMRKSAAPYGSALRLGSAGMQEAVIKARSGAGDPVAKNTGATAAGVKQSVVVQGRMLTSLDAFLDKYKVAAVVSM